MPLKLKIDPKKLDWQGLTYIDLHKNKLLKDRKIIFNIGSKVMKSLNIGSKKYEKIDHKQLKKITDELKKKSDN